MTAPTTEQRLDAVEERLTAIAGATHDALAGLDASLAEVHQSLHERIWLIESLLKQRGIPLDEISADLDANPGCPPLTVVSPGGGTL